jgi:hypothetical protein
LSLCFFHCCRQRIAEWSEPDPLTTDKKQKGPLLELLDRTQEEYRRLIAGANAAAGKKWDGMLEKIMESDEVASAIQKDDLYNLANVGINDDWSVEAGMQIFARKPEEAEADGWMRAGAPARLQLKSVAFAFDVMQEGMKILHNWEVLKEDKSNDNEKNHSLKFVAKEAAQQKAFQKVKALITYPSWMKRVAFAKVEKGQWRRRRELAAQGEVCRKRAGALDQLGKDVEEARTRSVIQWLLWLFGLPKSYKNMKELVSQLPQWVRPRVIKALENQPCFGKEYDFKEESKSVYVLKDECKMGVPIERDCGRLIPGIFKEWEEKSSQHRQVPRQERARKLGITVAKEEILEKGKNEEKLEEEKELDEGVETYLRVLKEDSYVVPERADVVEAIEKLFLKGEGGFRRERQWCRAGVAAASLPNCARDGVGVVRDVRCLEGPADFREDCDGISQARSKPAHRGRGADSGRTLSSLGSLNGGLKTRGKMTPLWRRRRRSATGQ